MNDLEIKYLQSFGMKGTRCPHGSGSYLVAMTNETRQLHCWELGILAKRINRDHNYGVVKDWKTKVVPVYEFTDYFLHSRYKQRVQIKPEFVLGNPVGPMLGPMTAARPTIMVEDHVFPKFIDDQITGVMRHRIVCRGSALKMDRDEIEYWLEFTPERGVNPEVIMTKLRLMYT